MRAVVTTRDKWPETIDEPPAPAAPTTTTASNDRPLVDFRVLYKGNAIRSFTAEADITKASDLRALLASAIRRSGGDTAEIGDYELEILRTGETLTTFVALAD